MSLTAGWENPDLYYRESVYKKEHITIMKFHKVLFPEKTEDSEKSDFLFWHFCYYGQIYSFKNN